MLCNATLGSPRADSFNTSFISDLFGSIGSWSKFDEGVKWDVEPWRPSLIFFHEVGVNAAKDGLVGDDEDVLGAFEFHDDGFETDDDVTVAIA